MMFPPPALPRPLWLDAPVGVALALFAVAWLTTWQGPWLYSEQGVLELSQFALLVVAVVFGLRVLARRTGSIWLTGWFVIATVGTIYTAGEEVSWGQHLIGWGTPKWLASVNDQGETNLHNVSSWLDQKPRAILELGIIVGGIVLPLAARLRPALTGRAWWAVVPPIEFFPTACLVELSRLGGPRWHALGLGAEPVLFHRASEVQELYFYWFVLLYLVWANRRFAPQRARP